MNLGSPYKKDNEVLNLSFEFALQIIKYTEVLEILKRYNMANQLFKSGTSYMQISGRLKIQRVKQTSYIK